MIEHDTIKLELKMDRAGRGRSGGQTEENGMSNDTQNGTKEEVVEGATLTDTLKLLSDIQREAQWTYDAGSGWVIPGMSNIMGRIRDTLADAGMPTHS